jgi:NADP-dependent 3-hydroxy acid dehydrogenase YdfG
MRVVPIVRGLQSNRSMSNDVIVITGGTAGVGRATARRFAREGCAVAVLARGQDGLDATAREIEQLGGRALALSVDVADAEQVFAAAHRIERTLGPITIWINNAMTTVFGPIDAISPAELRRVTDVCYHGFVWGTQAALRVMKPRDAGVIIQVGSALAHRAIPLQAAYCGAKHAIRGFTDALRSELHHDGSRIEVTMVQLPAVNTPQFRWCENKLACAPQPVPPIFQPEVIADVIYFAAYHPRREIYIGMPTIKAILGNKVIPGLLDRHLAGIGYDGQCTDQPARGDRRSNLFEPVEGDHGAHGDFDDRARTRDPIATVGSWLGAAGVRAVAAMAAVGVAFSVARLVRALRT